VGREVLWLLNVLRSSEDNVDFIAAQPVSLDALKALAASNTTFSSLFPVFGGSSVEQQLQQIDRSIILLASSVKSFLQKQRQFLSHHFHNSCLLPTIS
jgi:hypothetical protein